MFVSCSILKKTKNKQTPKLPLNHLEIIYLKYEKRYFYASFITCIVALLLTTQYLLLLRHKYAIQHPF